jgi:ATPase subunit of ABC transporter with duplicated ATPase domains
MKGKYMSILTVKNLSHGFGDRAIFNAVSFRLLKGEHIGLIGANGEGKSTFMNIITHKLEPDDGSIEWSKRVRVGYLDQHTALEKGSTIKDVLESAFKYLFDLEAEMNDMYMRMGDVSQEELDTLMEEVGTIQDILDHNDFYIIDSKVNDIAKGLGLLEIGLEKPVESLSGGQRTKILLAKLLLEKPDILLLDEPTNYLDEVHVDWLRKYLQDYENAFILISHDIPFLNSVVNLIYHMHNQELGRYVGDYDNFMRIFEAKQKQIESAYRQQQQEISDLEDFVARNKARVATRNMAMSRQKKLNKMDRIELSKEKPKPEFNFKTARTSGKLIFEVKDLVIGYEDALCRPLNLRLERNQKVAITGANGLGKTTLLRSVLGEIPSLSGTVELGEFLYTGYFEQEIKDANYKTCIEEVWESFPAFTQYEVRAALAKCGLTNQHIESKIVVLSGGEQAKVRLCKLINKETNFLILDEPTNHLDVDAKAELKRALQAYKGTILLISHEPEFYNDIVTEIWNLEKWTTKIV